MSKIKWSVTGKLKVRTQFDEIRDTFADGNGDVPLSGVRVRLSAKETKLDPSGFDVWGETFTDGDGAFEINNQKDKSKRYFRIEVKFENSRLRIYPEHEGLLDQLVKLTSDKSDVDKGIRALDGYALETEWIKIWEDDEKKGPEATNFRSLTFAAIGGEGLDGRNHRRHAEIWFLARTVMDQVESLGDDLGFDPKMPLSIKYPHHNPLIPLKDEQSYADPFFRTVFLIDNSQLDAFALESIVHEMMHIRNYDHSTSEADLAVELLKSHDLHDGRQDKTFTGFHEAAAEIWMVELYRQLFGETFKADGTRYRATLYDSDSPAERRPFTRTYLKNSGVGSLNDIDHFEDGWLSTFNLLLCRKVTDLDMNGTDQFAEAIPTSGPRIARKTVEFSFADLLKAFNALPPGFPEIIDANDMTLHKYFRRLGAVNPAFDEDMQNAYKKILDPNETRNPSDLLPRMSPPLTLRP
jgi:hypothetical protein